MSTRKFKLGDRVQVTGSHGDPALKQGHLWSEIGEIVEYHNGEYAVKFDKADKRMHSCGGLSKLNDCWWIEARNLTIMTKMKTPTWKVGDRVFVRYPALGSGTIVEIGNRHNPKIYLVQFDKRHPSLHCGKGDSKKEYLKNSVYWCQSYDLVPSSVSVPKQESEVPKVPKMIGEVPVEPTIYPYLGKHYLKVDTSKNMMFSTTQHGFSNTTEHSIDFIGILPPSCCKRVVDTNGRFYDTSIFILCPQEYLPPVEMTLAEIEKKLGHKVKVKV